MCLTKVTSIIKEPTDEVVIAWKHFNKPDDRTLGDAVVSWLFGSRIYKRREWHVAEDNLGAYGTPLTDDNGIQYDYGFHAFKSSFRAWLTYGNDITKVHLRKVHTIGKQGWATTYVAYEMYVP